MRKFVLSELKTATVKPVSEIQIQETLNQFIGTISSDHLKKKWFNVLASGVLIDEDEWYIINPFNNNIDKSADDLFKKLIDNLLEDFKHIDSETMIEYTVEQAIVRIETFRRAIRTKQIEMCFTILPSPPNNSKVTAEMLVECIQELEPDFIHWNRLPD